MTDLRRPAVLAQLLLFAGAGAAFAVPKQADSPQLVGSACPGLTSGALASARAVNMPSGVILRSGQMKIAQKDLDAEIGKAPEEVRKQLKRNLFFVLENKATRMFLDHEASSWAKQNKKGTGGGGDQLIQAYISSLTAKLAVSDNEARSFYDQNKSMMGGADFDKAKDQIKEYLLSDKRREAVEKHVASIGTRYEIDVNRAWAVKQYSTAMDNPVDKARKSGKPTMVDFGADGCRPCDMMAPILASLKKEYSGKANVLFVHVRKEQILAARYGVQSIPVQVFFDAKGREVFRHVGFFAKDQIVDKFAEMGAR